MTEKMNATGTVVIDDQVVATNPATGDSFPIPKTAAGTDGGVVAVSVGIGSQDVQVENHTDFTLIVHDGEGDVVQNLSPNETLAAPAGGTVQVGG